MTPDNDGPFGLPALHWRPAGSGDLDSWAALIARTAQIEKPVWFERWTDLEHGLGSTTNPPAQKTLLGPGCGCIWRSSTAGQC